ncbi:MAG: 50S ribosomal protein L9 [Neisseriales bacterium]|nr:MAG: 50S ribosomal protein L9 [Neisseriales bacterium]
MQIILMEDIARLGRLGDIVKVKDGFARNFLIPQKKAKRVTEANLAEFKARRDELEKQQAAILEAAKVHFEKLHGAVLSLPQKAGVEGKLFGSVTASDIAKAVSTYGVPVLKEAVKLPHGAIKMLGEYTAKITLHHEVIADITLRVIAES